MRRQLSEKVITRWYRPPEILMNEKTYDQSVDIWSFGCSLAEMMKCVDKKQTNTSDRFMFPGTSSVLLSPVANINSRTDKTVMEDTDQLKLILDIIGPQSKEDLAFLTNSRSKAYHTTIVSQLPETRTKVDYEKMFPWCS